MRRRLPKIFATLLAALLLGLASLPWWLGAALGGLGASRGLSFARYERIGYTRFALHEARFGMANVRVAVSRIEADTPLVAWWRKGEVLAGSWAVEVSAPNGSTAGRKSAGGWLPLRAQLERIATQLDRWVPRVLTQSGVVRWPGAELTCATAAWAERTLAVKALAYRELKADATLAFPGDGPRLVLSGASGAATLTSRGSDVTGEVTLWEQRAGLSAQFGQGGWLPVGGTLEAKDWTVPGEKLKLGELYTAVRARGKIEWRDQKLIADFAATGEPVKGKSVPPLEATWRGQGDTQSFTVEAFNVNLPGIVAQLSEPVTLERSGKFRQSGARFMIEADLAKQPWFAAKGRVTGEARWVANLGQAPVVEFQVATHEIAAAGWSASLAEAKGEFNWPRVRVTEGTLTGTAGETLTWRGGWDFKTKEIVEAAAEGQIRRATVARWVPADVQFDVVALKVAASGGAAAVKHEGRALVAGVKFRALAPLGLAVSWAGRGSKVETLDVEATTGSTTVSAAGALSGDAVQLSKLEWAQGGRTRLALTAPAEVRWRPTVAVESLHLAGPDSALDAALAWGESGRVELSAKNFSSVWLSELGLSSGPAWQVSSLVAEGAWERGPMTFSLQSTAAIELGGGKRARLAASAQGDKDGVRIEDLSVVEDGQSVVRVSGKLPLRLSPAAAQKAEFRADGAVALEVTTVAKASFWQELTALTGFELKEPKAMAHVTGTWARPQGTVRVKAARMSADATRFKRAMPTIEALDLELAGEANEIRLERLTVNVEGQAVRASARLPVKEGKWRELGVKPMALMRSGVEGKIEVPGAEVAALARFLPVFVAPKGRLQADVTYQAGALGGVLKVTEMATRPLGPLGVLQEINAEVAFAGRKMELRSATAQSGGQTVTLSGTVELPEAATNGGAVGDWMAGVKFDAVLKGENLPFVRQTGVLVRGDLDLKLTSPPRGAPRIAGTVRLRDSLFLSDVRALLPGGARTKARNPPYFAVEVSPYDAWRIDVTVTGEKFLKLRTALFNGVASAKFVVSGTLGDPAMRGEATIDEGAVKLPFATFAVQEGRVSLAPEQGIEPQVSFVGTVRRLNYDLRMEATGAASAPTLVFSSSPPLESGQVLLMVMAGESPRDEVTFSDRQRMTRLGTFLGQSLLASVSGESEAGERLSLSTGEKVSRQGRETYGFEYRLGNRWSLVGEYDEFDDFNAGLKWRVFSKGGTKEEKKK